MQRTVSITSRLYRPPPTPGIEQQHVREAFRDTGLVRQLRSLTHISVRFFKYNFKSYRYSQNIINYFNLLSINIRMYP